MNRIGFIILALVAFSVLFEGVAHAEGQPRVVIISAPGVKPAVNEVIDILAEHLSELDIMVEPWEADTHPEDKGEWLNAASQAATAVPGTVACFGYQCNEKTCWMFVIEPRNKALVELPVQVPKHRDLTVAFALAATARETLLGPLFPELERLVRHGENPGPPPPSPDSIWLRPPLEEERKHITEPNRPWLWVEGGYHGDYPYPKGHPKSHPINGPWAGIAIEPRKSLGAALSVGWLGIQEGRVGSGTVETNRLTTALALRIIFALGPAHITIAPVGRLDVRFVKIDPFESKAKHRSEVEIHAGGLSTWHLPLTTRLEAVVGAGVLASLLNKDYTIDSQDQENEKAISASVLRLIWLAGVSWSPL
ncbi:MAG: hypothetical protein GY847_39930 [Proteobacteria bacterium]|nr:hypothetical protein [Pseudomonadota bacterium]